MKKKKIIIVAATAAIAIGAGLYIHNYGFLIPSKITLPWGSVIETGKKNEASNSVYVNKVSELSENASAGAQNRFTGYVDTQETKNISFDSQRKLSQLFVKVGDTVKPGDPLFSYDTQDAEQKLQQYNLEIEEMNNTLQGMNEQLAQINQAAAKAKESEKPAYNIQILTMQNNIRKQQYDIAVKQLEQSKLQQNLTESVVNSDVDGIIKSINKNAASDNDFAGMDSYNTDSSGTDAFITILSLGNYRVKGTVNEMNLSYIYTGEEMLIMSRTDPSKIYHGTVSKIDSEPAKSNVNSYNDNINTDNRASKYNFYVEFTDEMDFIIGQHVVLEPDYGQEKVKDGIWIASGFIINEEGKAYVWKMNEDGYIEKTEIETGDTDEELDEVQIKQGISKDDYIAFPDDTVNEGASCITGMDNEV